MSSDPDFEPKNHVISQVLGRSSSVLLIVAFLGMGNFGSWETVLNSQRVILLGSDRVFLKDPERDKRVCQKPLFILLLVIGF